MSPTATRYTLDARITGTNESSPAWQAATNDARGFANELRAIPNEITVGIDLENVGNDIQAVNTRLREEINDIQVGIDFENISGDISRLNQQISQGLNDVKVGIDFENIADDVAALNGRLRTGVAPVHIPVELDLGRGEAASINARLNAALRDQEVKIDLDYDRPMFNMLSRDASQAAASMENLSQNSLDVGQSAIRSANVIRSSGFLLLIGAIGAAAYAAGPGLQAAGGAAVAFGSAGASAGAGVGLLVAAGRRLVDMTKDGEKGTKDLAQQWSRLEDQFGGENSVFDEAAKDLIPLSDRMLRLANRIMPSLGEEAQEVAREFTRSADKVASEWGGTEKNSVFRILDNASEVTGDLTRAVGRLGTGLTNTIGSPAATRSARQLSGYFDDISSSFQQWSRTERARDAIAKWLDRAKEVGGGVVDAVQDIARALGRFDDEDAKNVADAVRGIGRAAEFAFDEIRQTGRNIADFARWAGDAKGAVDKLDDSLRKATGGQKGFGDAVEDFMAKGPSAPGAAFGGWLRDMQRRELPEYRTALKKSEDQVDDWADAHKKGTKQAGDSWDSNIDPVEKFLLRRFTTRMRDNADEVEDWADAQRKATNKAENDWDSHVDDGIVGKVIKAFLGGMEDSADKAEEMARVHGQETNNTKKAWENNVDDGVTHGVIPDYVKVLGSSLSVTKAWVDDIWDALTGLLDRLGITNGGNDDSASDEPITGGGGHPSTSGGSNTGRGGRNSGSGSGNRGSPSDDFGFAMGGLWPGDAGGLAGPGRVAYVGEGQDEEAIINLDRYTDASGRAMAKAMDTWGERGWLERLERGKDYTPQVTPGPGDRSNVMAVWGGEGLGPTTHNWTPTVDRYQEETKQHVGGISTNTYVGHPGGERNTVDHWGPGGRGDHIAKSKGDAVEAWTTSNYPIEYYIWQGKIHGFGGVRPYDDRSDMHFDHIHVTYGGEGTGVSDGGADSGEDLLGEFLDALQGMINPPDLGMGEYGNALSSAMLEYAMTHIEQWAQETIPGLGGSDGSTGSSPAGLTADEVVSQGGWPDNAHKTAVGVMWEESGFIADNGNGTYEGLFAMGKPAMNQVGMSFSRVHEPLYNSTAAAKLFKESGWGPWAAYPPSHSAMQRGGQKITGYAEGGIHLGGENGLPVHMPRQVEDAFVVVAQAILGFTRHGKALANAGLDIGDEGGVGDGKHIIALTNEAGREAIAPLDNLTPEGREATEAAMEAYFPGVPLYRRGGLAPRSGWDLVGNDDVLGIHGGAADDARRAMRMWHGHGVELGRGGVSVEWREGPASGITTSRGRISVDRHLKGTRVGMVALAHELGHAMGLDHDPARGSLMHRVVGPGSRATHAEMATLDRMWGNGDDGGLSSHERHALMRHLNPEGKRRLRAWLRHHDDLPDNRRKHLLDQFGIHHHEGGGHGGGGGPGGGGGGGNGGPDDGMGGGGGGHHGGNGSDEDDRLPPGIQIGDRGIRVGDISVGYDGDIHMPGIDIEDGDIRVGDLSVGSGGISMGGSPIGHSGRRPGGGDSLADILGDVMKEIQGLRKDGEKHGKNSRDGLDKVKKQLKDVGIDFPSIHGIGKAAADGTLNKVSSDVNVQRVVQEALQKAGQRQSDLHGNRR